jgi:uncharacterized protein
MNDGVRKPSATGDLRRLSMARARLVAALSGAITGIAAGFIGVGGGEFRIPILVQVLGLPLAFAARINLVVGLFTVTIGTLRRWGQVAWTHDDVMLVVVMGAASLAGAALGVLARRRLPLRPLKTVVCAYLVVVGLWMLYESVAHVEHVLLDPAGAARWMLAATLGFAIAVVSGVMGLAGGEMRIPALLYLFGVPIKDAGTMSLMVSIPTVAAGAATDYRITALPRPAIVLAAIMGLASAAGVVIGAALVPYADANLIKGTLGVILLLATVRLTVGAVR